MTKPPYLPIPRFEPEVVQATADRQHRGDTAKVIAAVFCDSKLTHCYTVALHHWHDVAALAIADVFEQGCMAAAGGHNGIAVKGPDRDCYGWHGASDDTPEICIEPNWQE